jgi:hypothetical protein
VPRCKDMQRLPPGDKRLTAPGGSNAQAMARFANHMPDEIRPRPHSESRAGTRIRRNPRKPGSDYLASLVGLMRSRCLSRTAQTFGMA